MRQMSQETLENSNPLLESPTSELRTQTTTITLNAPQNMEKVGNKSLFNSFGL